MADDPPLVRVYLTPSCLETGEVREAWAEIKGDVAIVHYGLSRAGFEGEGSTWHRQKWAAENYARQLQACELDRLRERIARIEQYRFGRLGP